MPTSLAPEVIDALRGIVGPHWVSTDPCMLDTYAFYMNAEVLNPNGGRWLPRPAAAVLPATTEEVQAIVRLANRAGFLVKPISTGWGAWAAVTREGVVLLDLKRMDKIVEIDVKNRIAVVEPYVKAIVLQTELWKHGLNVHVVSCGGNHSILASATSAWGFGLTGSSMGYSARNLLGAEWVLPTGEILKLGSAGAGAGWFSADGPGPSLRGILRGFSGAFGGLGVFTKCAVKLYRWDGPPEVAVGGASPSYRLEEPPPNLEFLALSFPSAKALADAGYKLGEAEVSYAEFRLPAFFTALGATPHNAMLKKVWESGLFQKVAKHHMIVAVTGSSERELAWKARAIAEILREVGGVSLPLNLEPPEKWLPWIGRILTHVEDPLSLLRAFPFVQDVLRKLPVAPELKRQRISDLFWVLIRHATNTQGNFRPSQGMFTTLGSFDTWDLAITQCEWIAAKKREAISKGLILDDGGDLSCGGTFEHGHLGYMEGIGLYAPQDPRSATAVADLVAQGTQACIDQAFGIPIAGYGEDMNAKLGPHCSNYHLWMKRVKRALDPKTVCDPYFYAMPDEEEPAPDRTDGGGAEGGG